MCGLVGRAVREGADLNLADNTTARALETLRHRGPDMRGEYSDDNVWFGHTRLSILDLSDAGSQPMVTGDDRFVICYNGEVYNYAELSRHLNLSDLRSHSDTETVLGAFALIGVKSIALFNGMFSFAIYDTYARKIWLVRDRLGIKPMYYSFDTDKLSFASEIKALLALDAGVSQCNLSAVHEWLYYGASLGERTLYRGIRKLLPGHYLELDLATFDLTIERYWSPWESRASGEYTGSTAECIQRTSNLLELAVKRQLVSDVPIGVFLSGGIDSSAITAFASRHYAGKLATYSVGFDFDKGVNELPKAKAVAELYGTEHNELHVSGFEIADVVERMVDHHDMPFSDAANIPLYLLSSAIRDSTKVVLQGDGGDEMFGGYRRYTTLSYYRLARAFAKLGKRWNALSPRNRHYYRRQRYLNALTAETPAEVMALLLTEEDHDSSLAGVFAPEVCHQITGTDPFIRYRECQARLESKNIVSQMLLVDAMIILPDIFLEKVDRATMAANVEARVPFLDNDLVDFCMQLSGPQKVPMGRKKWLLKKALKGIVPSDVLHGKKTGFGVPYGYWLKGSLRPLFLDQLQAFITKNPGVLNSAAIQAMYDQHVSNQRDRSFLLWKLLNFMIWANRTEVSFAC